MRSAAERWRSCGTRLSRPSCAGGTIAARRARSARRGAGRTVMPGLRPARCESSRRTHEAAGGLTDKLLAPLRLRDELALDALDRDPDPDVRQVGVARLTDPVQFVGAGFDDHVGVSRLSCQMAVANSLCLIKTDPSSLNQTY